MGTQQTILVTGAGGYIGRFVVKTLLDMGLAVYVVDRLNHEIDPRAKILKVDIFSGDISIYDQLERPDICLHLAWKDGFVHNSDSHMQLLYSHFKFLKDMVNGGLKHLAVMGTMHEVGYHEGEVDEETQTNPHSLYGVAKNSLRQSLSIFLKDNDVVFQWLRAFYIYGDDQRNNSIFSKIIQSEKEDKATFPFTTGKNKYDFISVDELAEQIALCVTQTEINGIINCCSGNPISLRDMVESFIDRNQFKIKLKYGAFPDRPYDSPVIWGNNEKIQAIMRKKQSLHAKL